MKNKLFRAAASALLTLLLVLMFALVIAYFCYCVYFYGGRWVANPYNPRISSRKRHVVMGTLTDRDGTVLAYTDEDGRRRYNGSAATRKAVCQVVGDSGGKVVAQDVEAGTSAAYGTIITLTMDSGEDTTNDAPTVTEEIDPANEEG